MMLRSHRRNPRFKSALPHHSSPKGGCMNSVNLSTSPKFIDLFSGAGGFSLGFTQMGFQDLLAVEQNETAARTYGLNFPTSTVVVDDIKKVHSLDILNIITEKIDLLLASPPCEPFTSANPKRKSTPWERFYHDPQGDLVFHAIRIIGDIHPDFFVIENVIPITEPESQDILKEEFSINGYDKIFFNFVSAEKHGCPSIRKRIFISNIRLQLSLRKETTVLNAIGDLPSPNYPNNYQDHFTLPLARQVKDKVHKIRKGAAAVHFMGAKGKIRNWIRLNENDVCPTVMGKSRFLHPIEDRPLTIREQARLLSFPDNYVFTGSVEDMFNQIGEAVPPVISKQIAEIILNRLRKK